MDKPKDIRGSRRTLLKGAAAGLASGTLGTAVSPALFDLRRARAQEGTVRLTGFAANDQERPLLEQALEGFRTAFPNITLEYEPIPGNYNDVLQTQIAAGDVADVFYVQAEYAQDFASRNVLLALDDYMEDDGVSPDDFYAGLIQAFTWEDQIFGLPKDWSSIGMVYNQDMFEQASVTAAPTNWDELRTAAQQLKDSGVTNPIIIAAAFDKFLPFLFQAGGGVTNPEVTEITIGGEATIQALEYYYGLYADGLAVTFQEAGGQSPDDALGKKAGAIILDGNWVYPNLQQNAPDVPLGIAEPPAGPAGKGTAGFTVSYSIFAGTENPDAAWALVNYLTGPEGMATWTSGGFAMPSRPELAEDWKAQFPERAPYLDAGEYARVAAYGPGGQQFGTDANGVMEELFAGQIDPAEAATRLEEAATTHIQLAG